jgi:nitroreductase
MTMNVTQAVLQRRSVRAFLPTPVPRETVLEILEVARRTPSGGNLQPWHIHVLAGAEQDALRALVAERAAAGVKEVVQYHPYPPNLWEPYATTRAQTGEDLYATIGVARDDKAGRKAQFAENQQFFGAPVGLFFSLDRRFGPPQWSDMGMLIQTIMLLATERGLATCAQEYWSFWPDTVAEFLSLDDGVILFAGLALGFADEAAPINTLRTRRLELASFVTLRGL